MEQTGYEKGFVTSTKVYKYEEEKLRNVIQFDENDIIKITSYYEYDSKGNLSQISRTNKYMGLSEIIKYYYQ